MCSCKLFILRWCLFHGVRINERVNEIGPTVLASDSFYIGYCARVAVSQIVSK